MIQNILGQQLQVGMAVLYFTSSHHSVNARKGIITEFDLGTRPGSGRVKIQSWSYQYEKDRYKEKPKSYARWISTWANCIPIDEDVDQVTDWCIQNY